MLPQVRQYQVGGMQSNCYFVSCRETSETIIIDPGDDGDFLSQELLDLKLLPKAIVFTHGHFDHVLGALPLKLNFPESRILIHSADVPLLSRANSSSLHWTGVAGDPVVAADEHLKDQQLIPFGRCHLSVLHSPGHTPGSVCLYSQEYIFTGDTLFADDLGRTDFSYSNAAQLYTSLQKLKSVTSTTAFPGHGDAFQLQQRLFNLEQNI